MIFGVLIPTFLVDMVKRHLLLYRMTQVIFDPSGNELHLLLVNITDLKKKTGLLQEC